MPHVSPALPSVVPDMGSLAGEIGGAESGVWNIGEEQADWLQKEQRNCPSMNLRPSLAEHSGTSFWALVPCTRHPGPR